MKIEIKSWITGSVLFEGDFSCLAEAVKAAVKSNANLRSANLRSADLRYADLSYANLRSADLRSADLRSADLRSANLRYANLRSANLRSADLRSADLSSANLRYADLSYANLRSADLRSAKNIPQKTAAELLMCPEEGDFIGWKKCNDGVIAKLLIPAGAARSSATSRKCRAQFVKVLALFKDGNPFEGPAETRTNGNVTIYKVGKTVKPDKWDADRWNECSHGIHFFITRTEAENY